MPLSELMASWSEETKSAVTNVVLDLHVLKPCIFCGKGTSRVELLELIESGADELSIRELFISGIHPACWDKMFAEPED